DDRRLRGDQRPGHHVRRDRLHPRPPRARRGVGQLAQPLDGPLDRPAGRAAGAGRRRHGGRDRARRRAAGRPGPQHPAVAAHRDRRPDRGRAHGRRRGPAPRRRGHPRLRDRPGARALGQHVRVHPRRCPRRLAHLPRPPAAAPAALDGAVRDGLRGRRPHGGEPAARAGRRPARARAALLLARGPRRRGGARHRCLLGGRTGLRGVPAARRPRAPRRPDARAAAVGGRAGPAGLPRARRRLPAVDLRRAHRRPDLGGVRLGLLLELGPQGGLGVHHLGRLRRLPARARDGGLARAGSSGHRARRLCDAAVQLHRDQLLLRREQPALVRRL
ncbi:MAG: Cytochrome c-type biogenesis protein CcsA/ResC, partial [uncultured Frankineae bacterium]